MTLLEQAAEQLKRDEGWSGTPYQDTKGVWTVGYGTNLTVGSISKAAGVQMLMDRLQPVETACLALPIWSRLSEPRKGVLLNLGYALGVGGLMDFRKMHDWLKLGNYEQAAVEILDSDVAREQSQRYERLATQMREDRWV